MSAREDIDGSVREARGCAFYAYKTGTQSITDGAAAATLTWEAEAYDVGADFDLANDRFAAPVTGYYAFSIGVLMSSVADGSIVALALFVGANNYSEQDNIVGAAGVCAFTLGVPVVKLTAGDFVYAKVYVNSDADETVQNDARTYFAGTLLHT